MKKELKKKKKKTRSQLVKILDSVFSQYIRLDHADKKGMVKCYTCGDIHHWKDIQNGHFVSRGNYKYRWDYDNCKPQCYKCNIIYSGNYKSYTFKMIIDYGAEKISFMINDKEIVKIRTPEIEEEIEIYKERVKDLLDSLVEN